MLTSLLAPAAAMAQNSVRFDKPAYCDSGLPTVVNVTVVDGAADATSATVSAGVTLRYVNASGVVADTESLNFTTVETGAKFAAGIVLHAQSPQTANSGILEYQCGGRIQAEYVDTVTVVDPNVTELGPARATAALPCEDCALAMKCHWTLKDPEDPNGVHPGPRSTALSYDRARDGVLLFGGSGSADTWEWDGAQWALVTSTGPSARGGHAMIYDAQREVIVLFGGTGSSGRLGDTWEWNGSAWTLVANTGPAPRYGHSMAYDDQRGVTVLFGGVTSSIFSPAGDTWEWDGSTWTQVATAGPTPRYDSAMVYDAFRGNSVLFGGQTSSGPAGDTWTWDGVSWTQVATTGPTARVGHGLVYDSQRRRAVLFGGYSINGAEGDTWEWKGASWTLAAPAGSQQPAPRGGPAMAYDSLRAATVLFGGYILPGQFAGRDLGDTWEWTCPCHDEAAPLDPNGNVIFPAELDPNQPVVESDVDEDAGAVADLYPDFDTSLDNWYDSFPCVDSIGGTIPPEASSPNVQQYLVDANILDPNQPVTPEDIVQSVTQWEQAITDDEMGTGDPLEDTPNPLDPYFKPLDPHCRVPGRKYLFGGRDIVFVHGFDLDQILAVIAGQQGGVQTEWPQDEAEFYNGYWKDKADRYWEEHIQHFLTDRGYSNRYLVVSWATPQRLKYGVQAVLAQIDRAMKHGTGVYDPLHPGGPPPLDFGTPSYVIVSHSTGALLSNAMLSFASTRNETRHIAKHCKAHVSLHGAFSGSQLATTMVAGTGAAGIVLAPAQVGWACRLIRALLVDLADMDPSQPWSCDQLDFAQNMLRTYGSVLVDLVPGVSQGLWGGYVGTSPVRTATLVGGHPSIRFYLKYILQEGFDDGVLTINSMSGNDSPRLAWPSRFTADVAFPALPVELFDMGINVKRATGYFFDQELEPFRTPIPELNLLPTPAAGAVAKLSPTGMLEPILLPNVSFSGDVYDAENRYSKVYSYLQSASDHNVGCVADTCGYSGIRYPGDGNFEETRVLTSGAVYGQYGPLEMPYERDDQPLLSRSDAPHVRERVRGRKISFHVLVPTPRFPFLRPHRVEYWLWKRRYHLVQDTESRVESDYVYNNLLTGGGYICPEAKVHIPGGNCTGGWVQVSVTGPTATCTVSITTVAGQSAAMVALSLATKINQTACLSMQGITASSSGSDVVFSGITQSAIGQPQITDLGLLGSAAIPTLSTWGMVSLTGLIVLASIWALRRRGETPPSTPA